MLASKPPGFQPKSIIMTTFWENSRENQTTRLSVINLFAGGRNTAPATEAEVRKDKPTRVSFSRREPNIAQAGESSIICEVYP